MVEAEGGNEGKGKMEPEPDEACSVCLRRKHNVEMQGKLGTTSYGQLAWHIGDDSTGKMFWIIFVVSAKEDFFVFCCLL